MNLESFTHLMYIISFTPYKYPLIIKEAGLSLDDMFKVTEHIDDQD